ncbi:MAG: cell division protein ZapA [Deltaproteobacteria bacterium]|nr:cell division protein ZapA [Deltaproteobacteria bacterium]
MSTPRQVTLMGREFRIKTDEDANHVQAVADYVNAKIDELSAGNANAASQHLLLMTSLSLADELFKIREEHARLTAKIRASSQTLLSRLGA